MEDIKQQEVQELYEKVYVKTLNFISHKPRSISETQRRIFRYFPKKTEEDLRESLQQKIIDDLVDDGYLDDERYVAEYVGSFGKFGKKKSKYAITTFLYKKGIPKDLIQKGMLLLPGNFELEAAIKDAEKRLRVYKDKNPRVLKSKVIKYLFSKGYTSEIVYNAVDTALGVK